MNRKARRAAAKRTATFETRFEPTPTQEAILKSLELKDGESARLNPEEFDQLLAAGEIDNELASIPADLFADIDGMPPGFRPLSSAVEMIAVQKALGEHLRPLKESGRVAVNDETGAVALIEHNDAGEWWCEVFEPAPGSNWEKDWRGPKEAMKNLSELRTHCINMLRDIAKSEKETFLTVGKDGYTVSKALDTLREFAALREQLLSDLAHFLALREKITGEEPQRQVSLSYDYTILGEFEEGEPFLDLLQKNHDEFTASLITTAALAGGKKIEIK
jgi:hypothetical protein